MISYPETHRAARHGALMLDAVSPGWVWTVTADKINMERDSLCVLGMVYGSYHEGWIALNLSPEKALEYGFDCHPSDDNELKSLEKAWHSEIMLRRENQNTEN